MFLRFALRGAWAPRVPAWSPACGRRGPRPGHSLPWRVVDPVGWDWGWVPRGLHLKCRRRFCFLFVCLFVFFYCEKNLKLNSEEFLDYRELTCPLSHGVISTVIWAICILFFYFHIWKLFSPNERRLASWLGLGMLWRLMEAMLAFIYCLILFGKKYLENGLWQRLPRIYFFLIFISLIINNHLKTI